MIEIVNGIIIISLIIIIYKYFEKQSYDVVMVKSQTNGKNYLVRNLEDKQEAANLLGTIANKLEKLVNIVNTTGYEKIYEKYIKNDVDIETGGGSGDGSGANDDNNINEGQTGGNSSKQSLERDIKMKLKDDIARLVKNFNSDAFSETTPDNKYTSYSVNKGEKIVFCLRQKKEGEQLVKENIMLFVSIHECAHLMTKSVGHEPDFWSNMRLLLKIAIDNGIYKNIDFNKKPEEYCGVSISDSVVNK
jgi:predicted metal-dependent hydrolase